MTSLSKHAMLLLPQADCDGFRRGETLVYGQQLILKLLISWLLKYVPSGHVASSQCEYFGSFVNLVAVQCPMNCVFQRQNSAVALWKRLVTVVMELLLLPPETDGRN